MVAHLQKLPLFQNIPPDILNQLNQRLERCRLEKEEFLFHQGDPGDSLYIIEEGKVSVVAEHADGSLLTLNQFGPGEFFGEMSLVDHESRSAGAVADTPALLLKLTRQDFEAVINSHPLLLMEITRSLSLKLRFAAAYIQKAVQWSQNIASGNYNETLGELENAQALNADQTVEDDISLLIATFFQMTKNIQKREAELKEEIYTLKIEVDQQKKAKQVTAITETEYFQQLQEKVEELRQSRKK